MPVANFLHEGGHWLVAKAVGVNPKMLLQRVEVGDESQFSTAQMTAYNWGGPAVNYAIAAASLFYPPLAPAGLLFVCHRLAPNTFASIIYLKGRLGFTTDETKQFSKEQRLIVAVLFSVMYLLIALLVAKVWLPNIILSLIVIVALSVSWFGYLIALDFLDKTFFA